MNQTKDAFIQLDLNPEDRGIRSRWMIISPSGDLFTDDDAEPANFVVAQGVTVKNRVCEETGEPYMLLSASKLKYTMETELPQQDSFPFMNNKNLTRRLIHFNGKLYYHPRVTASLILKTMQQGPAAKRAELMNQLIEVNELIDVELQPNGHIIGTFKRPQNINLSTVTLNHTK